MIAVVLVYLNFVANALSISWAASVSPTLVSIVALGGYVVRLIIYTVALVLLNQLPWFSPVAFALALVPAIVGLLIFEAKALSGRMQADLWTFDGARPPVTGAVLAATFEPPSTKDFVYGCWGPPSRSSGSTLCFNFIAFLLVLTTLIVLALFFFAFRKPKVMPGKFQLMMELGVQFVRENIADADARARRRAVHAAPRLVLLLHPDREHVRGRAGHQLLGEQPRGDPARAGPGLVVHVQHRRDPTSTASSATSGTRRIIPEAPAILRYGLLMPIEFISNIIVRPITLTVRLTANFVAGHFLLAIFFLGTVFFLEDGPKTWPFAALSFPLALMLVGLELFVAALQAFIFAVLSASYIGQAMAEAH